MSKDRMSSCFYEISVQTFQQKREKVNYLHLLNYADIFQQIHTEIDVKISLPCLFFQSLVNLSFLRSSKIDDSVVLSPLAIQNKTRKYIARGSQALTSAVKKKKRAAQFLLPPKKNKQITKKNNRFKVETQIVFKLVGSFGTKKVS